MFILVQEFRIDLHTRAKIGPGGSTRQPFFINYFGINILKLNNRNNKRAPEIHLSSCTGSIWPVEVCYPFFIFPHFSLLRNLYSELKTLFFRS